MFLFAVGCNMMDSGTKLPDPSNNEPLEINSFQDCVDAGYDVMESSPRMCEANGETFVEDIPLKEECNLNGGKWLDEYKECEGIDEEQCNLLGGEFDECASDCRHEPESEVCTTQCIPVCSLGSAEKQEYDSQEELTLREKCQGAGGEWIGEHNECEFTSEKHCEETGGEFDECASACRHDDSDMCIEVCVPLCKY